MGNFVLLYLEIGKIKDVMELLRDFFQKSCFLGDKYFFVFIWMFNVVGGFVKIEYFDIVEEFGRKVLVMSIEVLGENYFDIIFVMFNFVMMYCG